MIHIVYGYKTKVSKVWKYQEMDFKEEDYVKAFRFLQKVKHTPEMFIVSWGAASQEAYQYLKKGCF